MRQRRAAAAPVWSMWVAMLVTLAGCATSRPDAYRPDLPAYATVPESKALPIDGVWECIHGVRVRIVKGRAYIIKGRAYADVGGPAVPSGSVFVRDILSTGGLGYTCKAATANWSQRRWGYGPAQLRIAGLEKLVLSIASNASIGGTPAWQDEYRLIRLDRPFSIEMAVLSADSGVSRRMRQAALERIPAQDRAKFLKAEKKRRERDVRATAKATPKPKARTKKKTRAPTAKIIESLRYPDRAKQLALAQEILKRGRGDRFLMPDVKAVARQPVGCLTIRQNKPKELELLVEYPGAALAATVTVSRPVTVGGWFDREVDYRFSGEGALANLAATYITWRGTSDISRKTGRVPTMLLMPMNEDLSLQLLVLTPLGRGSVHRFLGKVSMAELGMPGWYTNGVKEIHSDEADPLVFAVTDAGYVHLGGKGTLVFQPEYSPGMSKLLEIPHLRLVPGEPVELTALQAWQLAGTPDEGVVKILTLMRLNLEGRIGYRVWSGNLVGAEPGFRVDKTGRLVIGR